MALKYMMSRDRKFELVHKAYVTSQDLGSLLFSALPSSLGPSPQNWLSWLQDDCHSSRHHILIHQPLKTHLPCACFLRAKKMFPGNLSSIL